MAVDTSHAAKQYDRTFSVELFSEVEPATVLVAALSDFLEAVDRATEWLEQEDPARTKKPSLAIFATTGGIREQVWAYPPDSGESDTAEPKRLVELFGFNPVTWNPQGGGANPVRGRPREREPSPPNEHRPAGLVTPAEPDSPPTSEPVGMRLTTAYMRRLREALGGAWNDRPSRCCLILGSTFLWLTATLLEPAFLVSALAAATVLWTRRGHRADAVPDDVDDWF
jgi:hypothetical protein